MRRWRRKSGGENNRHMSFWDVLAAGALLNENVRERRRHAHATGRSLEIRLPAASKLRAGGGYGGVTPHVDGSPRRKVSRTRFGHKIAKVARRGSFGGANRGSLWAADVHADRGGRMRRAGRGLSE